MGGHGAASRATSPLLINDRQERFALLRNASNVFIPPLSTARPIGGENSFLF